MRAGGGHERLPRFALESFKDRYKGFIGCADAEAAELAPEAKIKKQVMAAIRQYSIRVGTELGDDRVRMPVYSGFWQAKYDRAAFFERKCAQFFMASQPE